MIGCQGGVGRAVLSLLENNPAGQKLLTKIHDLFVVDQGPYNQPLPVNGAVRLEPKRIETGKHLADLIRQYDLTKVIDLSSLDTLDCIHVCEEFRSDFLCTSVEEWPGHGFLPTDEAIARLLPPRQPLLTRQSHLVGSGANPGIVNSLTFEAIKKFAEKVGVEATTRGLGLHSILITEEDTSTEPNAQYSAETFPMTWSPEHCLEELFEPRSFYAHNGQAKSLDHAPTDRLYRVRCGDREIEGLSIPHEETKTLSRQFSDVDIAFIYRLPQAARQALASRRTKRSAADWRPYRLLPSPTLHLEGHDRVGVLLCSDHYGEYWLGFDTPVTKGMTFGTNATQLQVAAGVIAGWSQLGNESGIHFVEDLNSDLFLESVSQILGPPIEYYDSAATPVRLQDRALKMR